VKLIKEEALALFELKASVRATRGGFRVINALVRPPRAAAGLHKGLGKPCAMGT